MKSFAFTVTAPNGIHGRPATELVQLAKGFRSNITLECAGRSCDLKQLLKLMLVAVQQGETVNITVSGSDEEPCAAALEAALKKDF